MSKKTILSSVLFTLVQRGVRFHSIYITKLNNFLVIRLYFKFWIVGRKINNSF